MGTLNFNTFNFIRYDGIIGYEDRDLDVYLKHISTVGRTPVVQAVTTTSGTHLETTTLPSKSETHSNPLGLISLTLNYRLKGTSTLAFLLERDFQLNDLSILVGGEHKINDKITAKLRADNDFNLALATKIKVNHMLNLTVSGLIAAGKGADAFNFNHILPIPLGFTAELAV